MTDAGEIAMRMCRLQAAIRAGHFKGIERAVKMIEADMLFAAWTGYITASASLAEPYTARRIRRRP